MLRTPEQFWADETESSILLKNLGFLEGEQKKDEFKSLLATGKQWLSDAGLDSAAMQAAEAKLEAHRTLFQEQKLEYKRIFQRDSERAFAAPANQLILMQICTIMEAEMGDYHQGMSLIGAFFLLTLSQAEVLALLSVVASNPKYLPNFWKSESVASATDGYLFMDMVTERVPDVAAKLTQNFILPETYVQKWFCALCVHVLPFSGLVKYFSSFFAQGHSSMFLFGLTLVTQFREQILAAVSQAKIYELLRLEMVNKHVTLESIDALFDNSSQIDLSGLDFTALRAAAYDKHLKARMESAKRAHDEDIIDEEWDCQFCDGKADYFCRDCQKYICDDCRDSDAGEHVEETCYSVDAEDRDNPDF